MNEAEYLLLPEDNHLFIESNNFFIERQEEEKYENRKSSLSWD